MIMVMEPGNIIEYIDRQKIMCAVVIDVKKQKLRLLTENDREIKLSKNRILYKCETHLELSASRYKLVENLKKIANKRESLVKYVDIKELWEVLNTEQEWIDLATMREFCFPDNSSGDHEAAVARAFFKDRLYFKFDNNRFFPNSEERVEQIIAQRKETERKKQIIDKGGDWLKSVFAGCVVSDSLSKNRIEGDRLEFVKILKSFYLFESESPYYESGKAMLAGAGISSDEIFQLLVKLGIWDENENIELYRYEIPVFFSDKVMKKGESHAASLHPISTEEERKDLTMLPLMTIDGPSTTDYDDALSIENKGDYYQLGIHISDVGHCIKKGDAVDREAIIRGSSIYMPDRKLSMIPSCLAEDLCSLKVGELRPAISIMVKLSQFSEIIDYEIFPSIIKIKSQLTYHDVNMVADENKEILVLYDVAKKFRQKRLDAGAVQISLPEINVQINENGEINVNRINRESPARMIVAEIMIMTNWLMARFLAEHNVPAIFRSQAEPRERLYRQNKGTLFQNWMQRKLLSRFVLNNKPEYHSGLGLNAYVTATSPIRKYFDLATQRQIRAIFGLEKPYTKEEIKRIILLLAQPMSCVSRIQYMRNRYWLLKYLENKTGQKEEAIVLYRRNNSYQILIKEYMIECSLPLSSGISLKPQDLIQITIQHVNARKDLLCVFMG